jgi:hypothetical protein
MKMSDFVIWSWEHVGWWRPNHCGYTEELNDAGRYSFEEASKIVVGHIPAGEEVAMWYEEAVKIGRPKNYAQNGG